MKPQFIKYFVDNDNNLWKLYVEERLRTYKILDTKLLNGNKISVPNLKMKDVSKAYPHLFGDYRQAVNFTKERCRQRITELEDNLLAVKEQLHYLEMSV